MKLGAVPKLDKRNTITSKKSEYDDMSENCDVIVRLPGCGIPDAWSVKLTFLLTVVFFLTKTENRIKKF